MLAPIGLDEFRDRSEAIQPAIGERNAKAILPARFRLAHSEDESAGQPLPPW